MNKPLVLRFVPEELQRLGLAFSLAADAAPDAVFPEFAEGEEMRLEDINDAETRGLPIGLHNLRHIFDATVRAGLVDIDDIAHTDVPDAPVKTALIGRKRSLYVDVPPVDGDNPIAVHIA